MGIWYFKIWLKCSLCKLFLYSMPQVKTVILTVAESQNTFEHRWECLKKPKHKHSTTCFSWENRTTLWYAQAPECDTRTDTACRERITNLCLIGFSGDVFSRLSLGCRASRPQGREHWHNIKMQSCWPQPQQDNSVRLVSKFRCLDEFKIMRIISFYLYCSSETS